MLSFKKFVDNTSKKYVGLYFSKESNKLLLEYAQSNDFDLTKSYDGDDIKPEEFDFHTTIYFTSNKVFSENGVYKIKPIELQFDKFELLGKNKNIPVLRVKLSEELLDLRNTFTDLGFKDEWPSYKPHVSLSYNYNEKIKIKELPKFKIVANTIKIENQDA